VCGERERDRWGAEGQGGKGEKDRQRARIKLRVSRVNLFPLCLNPQLNPNPFIPELYVVSKSRTKLMLTR